MIQQMGGKQAVSSGSVSRRPPVGGGIKNNASWWGI